jgi:hypothetical protein
MKKNNKFVARLGRNNTIRIFEAATGRLMREILVSGKVCDNPVCVEAKVSVEIISEGKKYKAIYNLPNGSLQSKELI